MWPDQAAESVQGSRAGAPPAEEEASAIVTAGSADALKLLVTLSATDVPLEPKRYLESLFLRWLFLPETVAWIEQVLDKLSVTGKISDEEAVATLTSPKPTSMRQDRLNCSTSAASAAQSPDASRKSSLSETPAPNSPAATARNALHRITYRPGNNNYNGAETKHGSQDRSLTPTSDDVWNGSSPQSPISLFIRSHAVFPIWSPAEEKHDVNSAHNRSCRDDWFAQFQSKEDSSTGQHESHTNASARVSSSTDRPDSGEHDERTALFEVAHQLTPVVAGSFPAVDTQNSAKAVPQFYYPDGRTREEVSRTAEERRAIQAAFDANDGMLGQREVIELVMDIIGLPSFVSLVIFERLLRRQQRLSSPNLDEEAKNDATNRNGWRDYHRHGNDAVPDDQINEAVFMQWYMEECAGYDRHARLFHAIQRSREVHSNVSNRTDTDASDSGAQSSDTVPSRTHSHASSTHDGTDRDETWSIKTTSRWRCFLVSADFRPFIDALLATHPGLQFLQATPEFQHRYAETVIERIYYYLNRPDGRAFLADLRRRRLLDLFKRVDEEEDINLERACFSYEHFYVIYCRFWELDTDHDLTIDREDLLRYNGHALTYRIIDCIFSGRGRPLDCARPDHMSYTDFVWFILSEEDKNSDTALDYWFRCIDADGDGQITLFDIDWLYSEQLHRMECLGHEPVAFEDILCQLLDMISKDANPPVVTRSALRASRMQSHFFNILFNLNKFIAIESRDPVLLRQERATPDLSDWDRFAALEYLRLSAEDDEASMEAWNASELEGMYSASSIAGVESPF